MNPKAPKPPAHEHGPEVVRLEGVCREYPMGGQRLTAICNISFTVRDNEMVCILGPSGSGKSTLLHLIGLLDTPTRGKVFIDGKDTTSMGDAERSRVRGSRVGFVFQTFNLVHSLTALENVELPLMIADMPSGERRRKAAEMLGKVGLGGRMRHYPGQMSGGERQRVAIARALVHEPELILADEPTGNLDSKTGMDILGVFRRLHQEEGRTIVIITHDESITALAERIIRIRDGKVFEDEVLKK